MIVAPQPLAAEEGVKVLKRGGNAVDTAVVAGFVQGVVDPFMCGIGGFGWMHVYVKRTGEEKILDFNGRAGSKATPTMWEDINMGRWRDGFGYRLKGDINDVGYKAVATPGTVRGFYEALSSYGTMEWKDALQPAIRYAEQGYPVSAEQMNLWKAKPEAGRTLNHAQRLSTTSTCSKIYLKKGNVYEAGDLLIQRELASTLRRIANEGPELFYEGDIAETIASDMEQNSGFITARDLSQFRVKYTDPLISTYRGLDVRSNQPPGGGITLLEALNILEGFPMSQYSRWTVGEKAAEFLHKIASTLKAAHVDRATYVGDLGFSDIPIGRIVSKENASQWRKRIDGREEFKVPEFAPNESPHTTHLSVVDRQGNAVALTHTIGASGASGVVTLGLGFLYNNAMNSFVPLQGHPNSIAPGKGRVSGISPTMLFSNGELYMVLGSPGANTIISSVMQTIVSVVDLGMSIVEAVSAPRIDCQGDIIDAEARIPLFVLDELRGMGWQVERWNSSYAFGRVQTLLLDRSKGRVEGASDPRGGGVALSE